MHLHVFSDGIRPNDLVRLRKLAARQGAACSTYDVAHWLDKFPALRAKYHYSRAACGRLFIADLLPWDVDFILYLDCDVICVGSLADLWALRERVSIAAAVPDAWVNADPEYKRRVGQTASDTYYNSGVVLINVREWRQRQLFPVLLGFMSERSWLRYPDQDAINGVLSPEMLKLEQKWNVLISAPDLSQAATALRMAVNIHYCAGLKPWHLGYTMLGGAAGGRFRAAKSATPWRWKLPDLQFGRMKKKAISFYESLCTGAPGL
jgi:UDP-glucose/galactose:(glucosyl)LPS alpha-1,2-glucosyl/galactosyltransferase/UDP-glucose:(galactosyl)LPS alpha-1,2-glucosyltransferase